MKDKEGILANGNRFEVVESHPGRIVLPRVLREIKDLRRTMSIVLIPVEAGGPKVEMRFLPESVDLTDKRRVSAGLEDSPRRRLHIPYIGVLMVGEEPVLVIQGDKSLANSSLFQAPLKGREMQPLFHSFILSYVEELQRRELPDVYSFAPRMGNGEYVWWLGRDRFVGTEMIGKIAGRPIKHLRVWQERGLIATNSTNRGYFMPARAVLEAAIADQPLDERKWMPIIELKTGIDFLTAVFCRGEQQFITVRTVAGVDHDIPLGDPEEMAQAVQEKYTMSAEAALAAATGANS